MACKNDSNEVFEDGLCAECYVRAIWKDISVSPSGRHVWIGGRHFQGYGESPYTSAAEYTRNRKREIAEIEEEATVIDDEINLMYRDNEKPIYRRVLARERELLESKRKGMR